MPEKTPEANGGSKGDVKPTYKPMPADVEAVEAYRAAKAKAAPRLKIEATGKNEVNIRVDHPDKAIGGVALMSHRNDNSDFYEGLIGQLVNASKEK